MLMAFDQLFPDVAAREVRAIELRDREGNVATFVFRELYCAEPGCDCRRVLFHVHWVEGECVAASISYVFDRPKRRDERQIFLDRLNPQSEDSEGLLGVLDEMLATDCAYRERLKRHYRMWKDVVDDPSHPDHAKVASHRGEPAAPRQRGRKKPGSTGVALVAAKAARAGGKLQQRFRRLLDKVDRLRERVSAWKAQRPEIDRAIATYGARFDAQCRIGREMVRLLDEAYGNAVFTKTDRRKMAALIGAIAGDLVEHGHADLKPIYNRYSRRDFDAESAAADAANAAVLKSVMEMFGVDVGDADVRSVEELHAHVDAQLEREQAAAEARRAKRKKSARQVAAEARRADEHRNAHKAVQEVYRALARELHPDRERDPAERARKTALMSEVNVAYEAKDLLRLLELQLELERVEAARVDSIADERLHHYNKILDEQSKQLAQELEEIELPFRMELDVPPSATLVPGDVIARVHADTARLEQRLAGLERDLEAIRDVGRLKPWLKAQPVPRADRYAPS